jgi:hypothetical protein
MNEMILLERDNLFREAGSSNNNRGQIKKEQQRRIIMGV